MADNHLFRGCRCTLDPWVFATNLPPEQNPQGQHIWSRPLARTWTVMLVLCSCLVYCARMAMPVCVVSMAATFGWSKTESGLVLGGFYWGYCLTQILGGHTSDKFGGERILFLSTASWAIITAATPLLGRLEDHSVAAMTIARFLMGLLQGVVFPSLVSVCSQRMVEGERGFLMSCINGGSYFGMLVVGGVGSLMLERRGWQSVFYATGALSGLWALIVCRFLLQGQVIPNHLLSASYWSVPKLHWLSHLKKGPVCAMVLAHMCHSGASYALLSWLPTYFKDTFPHAPGWLYNVIPWTIAIPSAVSGGYVSDYLINAGYGVSAVRKIMQFVAMGVSSVFMLLVCKPVTFTFALASVSAAVGCNTFSTSGVSINVQDLAPSCAGALYGFMNMCGAFMGLLVVFFSGYLIEVTASWPAVFSLIGLLNVTGLGFFLVLGDASRVDLEDYRAVSPVGRQPL